MDIKEYLEAKHRMCKNYTVCVECPLTDEDYKSCAEFEMYKMEEAEKIVGDFIENNRPLSNGEVFEKIFGHDISNCNGFPCKSEVDCIECEFYHFWEKDYEFNEDFLQWLRK